MRQIIKIGMDPQNSNVLVLSTHEKEVLHSFVLNMIFRHPWSLIQVDKSIPLDTISNNETFKAIKTFLNYLGVEEFDSFLKLSARNIFLS